MKPLYRCAALLAAIVALAGSPAAAQSTSRGPVNRGSFRGDGVLLVRSIGHTLTDPLRWGAADWSRLGVAAAGVLAIGAADGSIRHAVRSDHAEELDDVAGLAEPLGSAPSFAVLGAFYSAGILVHRPRERATAVEGLAASVVAGGMITPALKFVTGRSRPRSNDGTYHFRLFSNRPSFPSGHVTQAFAVASVIAAEHRSWLVKVAAYGAASLVGFARVRHDAHFASDVLAGALVGGATGQAVAAFGRDERATSRVGAWTADGHLGWAVRVPF